MRREVCLIILILVTMIVSCDSVDPAKSAFDIQFCNWYAIKLSSNGQYFHDSHVFINKEKATELIEKHFRRCLPEIDVLLDIRFAENMKDAKTEIVKVEEWLNSLGFKRITIWQCSRTGMSLVRNCSEGVIKNLDKDHKKFENATLKQKWNDVLLDDNELQKLYEISKKESFETIGPILIDVLYPDSLPFPMVSGIEPPHWKDSSQSMFVRKKRMAEEVWFYFTRHKNDNTAKTVLMMLKDAKTEIKKSQLILILLYYQWSQDCEQTLRDIASDDSEKVDIRVNALLTLLIRCDTESYIPFCIDVIFSIEDQTKRCSAFNRVIDGITNFSELKKENANLIILSGFRILSDLVEKDFEPGYSLAVKLGKFLKIQDEFKPDQSNDKYEGDKQKYLYLGTVINALKWWRENKYQYTD